MDVEEHLYFEDPTKGPPDARTTLPGVNYFFLGNGHVLAAVQVDPSGVGTPLGLLVMDPERFGHKRAALSFDPEVGLAATKIRLETGGRLIEPRPGGVEAWWSDVAGIPAVCASWRDGSLLVEETFFCPDRADPRLVREARFRSENRVECQLVTGRGGNRLERRLVLDAGESTVVVLCYELQQRGSQAVLSIDFHDRINPDPGAFRYWHGLTSLFFTPGPAGELLSHLFGAARRQLPAVIAASGAMDGSYWQYNLEWVRDQALVVAALCQLGATSTAQTMLDRLLGTFVTEDGDTVDSSRRRPPREVELDQNGILLLAARTYADWTGDLGLIESHWPRIHRLAEYPLRDAFRHAESGLLSNRREFWERHELFGIDEGMELAYQLYVSIGLTCAAELALRLGHAEDAARWNAEADRLKTALLADPRFALVENGHFVKRRRSDGSVQETAELAENTGLPWGTPLTGPGPHFLDPDTSSVLPIALEFVDPRGDLARETLKQVERLWNQTWKGGGYCRYNVTSEADSPGPWPFASLFVARAYFEAGEDEKVWRVLEWLGSTSSGAKAGTWFEFYGPKRVPPCPPTGITPWTWAELVTLFVHHVLGVRPRQDALELRPRLLEGTDRAEATLPVRGHRVHLSIRRAGEGDGESVAVDGVAHSMEAGRIVLPLPDRDIRVEIQLGP